MGGHNKGDIASQLACEDIASAVSLGAAVPQAIQRCHQKIQLRGFQSEQLRGMGTTIVCSTSTKNAMEIFWVGDSRAYKWHDSQLTQLTKDHSVVQNLLDIGEITPEQALQHLRSTSLHKVLVQS